MADDNDAPHEHELEAIEADEKEENFQTNVPNLSPASEEEGEGKQQEEHRAKTNGDDEGDADADDEAGSGIEGIRFVDYRDESQLETIMELVGRDLSEPYSIFTYRYFLQQWPELCILAESTPLTTTEADTDTNTPKQTPKQHKPHAVGCVICKIDAAEAPPGQEQEQEPFPREQEHEHKHEHGTYSNLQNLTTPSGEEGENKDDYDHDQTPDLAFANGDMLAPANTNLQQHQQQQPSGYIAMLAVDSGYRRSGIGSALVRRIMTRMRNMGCVSVTLETEVRNGAAIRLYEEKLGFLREELLQRYYLNWGDAYRLRLWFDEGDDDNERV